MRKMKTLGCFLCIFSTLLLTSKCTAISESTEQKSEVMEIAIELLETQFGSEEKWLADWLLAYIDVPSGTIPTADDVDLFCALNVSIDSIIKLGMDDIDSIYKNRLIIGFYEFEEFQMRFWLIDFIPIDRDTPIGTCSIRIDGPTGVINVITPGGRQIKSYRNYIDNEIRELIDQWDKMALGGLDSWATYNGNEYPGESELSLREALGFCMETILILTGHTVDFFYHTPFNLLYAAEQHMWQIGFRFSSPPESIDFIETYYIYIDSITGKMTSMIHSLEGNH